MSTGLKVSGKKVIMEGTLNLEDLTLENLNFAEPISIESILNKEGIDGRYVKITFQEIDKELTQEDIDQIANEEE